MAVYIIFLLVQINITAHVFGTIAADKLISLLCDTNQSAQGRAGSGKLVSLQISIFSFLPKQPVNNRGPAY